MTESKMWWRRKRKKEMAKINNERKRILLSISESDSISIGEAKASKRNENVTENIEGGVIEAENETRNAASICGIISVKK
jgi:hypothetical protein